MSVPVRFDQEGDWDPDDDELRREHDPVPPALELCLAEPPSDETSAAVARVLVRHGAQPQSRWEAVLVSAEFLHIVARVAAVR